MKKKKARPQKWDIDYARTLYIQGSELSDIVKLPEFQGLSRYYLKNLMVRGRWKAQRDLTRSQAAGLIEKSLVESIKDHQEAHLKFMLAQIDQERSEIVARKKLGNVKDQKERLEILSELDKTARRTLGLDDQNVGDKQALSLNAMINLHVTGPQKADALEIISGEYQKKEEEDIQAEEKNPEENPEENP